MKPMKLNTTKDLDGLGFRRVVCKGIFDEQRSIYVGPKPRSMSKSSEIGFYVITPLLPIPNEPNRSGIYSLYAQTKLKSFWSPYIPSWCKYLFSCIFKCLDATSRL